MMKKISYKILINIIGFYVCWWLCVYGVIQGKYFMGPKALFVYMIVHFIFLVDNKVEYLYIGICAILAFLFDTALLNLHLIEYRGFLSQNYKIAPLWVVCLWLCYAFSIFHSFKILQKRYKGLMILGVFSGPLIYYYFSKVGIITLLYSPIFILMIIGLLWMFIIPFYVYLADKLIEYNVN